MRTSTDDPCEHRSDPFQDRLLALCARARRRSLNRNAPVQPLLARLLARFGIAVLAPVLDSLCHAFEHTLQRAMRTGTGWQRSDDERLLCRLVAGERPQACLDCPAAAADLLQCALCSTRIMLALALPPGRGATA